MMAWVDAAPALLLAAVPEDPEADDEVLLTTSVRPDSLPSRSRADDAKAQNADVAANTKG
jgi:hypothetical protein